jgi:hypothetical protein
MMLERSDFLSGSEIDKLWEFLLPCGLSVVWAVSRENRSMILEGALICHWRDIRALEAERTRKRRL